MTERPLVDDTSMSILLAMRWGGALATLAHDLTLHPLPHWRISTCTYSDTYLYRSAAESVKTQSFAVGKSAVFTLFTDEPFVQLQLPSWVKTA